MTTLELLNRFWVLSHWRVGGGINEKKSIETKRGENYEILYLGAVTWGQNDQMNVCLNVWVCIAGCSGRPSVDIPKLTFELSCGAGGEIYSRSWPLSQNGDRFSEFLGSTSLSREFVVETNSVFLQFVGAEKHGPLKLSSCNLHNTLECNLCQKGDEGVFLIFHPIICQIHLFILSTIAPRLKRGRQWGSLETNIPLLDIRFINISNFMLLQFPGNYPTLGYLFDQYF